MERREPKRLAQRGKRDQYKCTGWSLQLYTGVVQPKSNGWNLQRDQIDSRR